jgi:hypothetical protein
MACLHEDNRTYAICSRHVRVSVRAIFPTYTLHRSNTVSHQAFLLDTRPCIVFGCQPPGMHVDNSHFAGIGPHRAQVRLGTASTRLHCTVRVCRIWSFKYLRTITRNVTSSFVYVGNPCHGEGLGEARQGRLLRLVL